MKHSLAAGAMLLSLFPGIAGCGPTEIKWTEEVRQHDGRVIQVKRRTELTASGFPVQKRGRAMYHELCYPPMGIHWKSKPEYNPENFDVVDGKAYVKVSLRGCSTCMLHGYPDTSALYFVWVAGTWQRIESSKFPAQLRINLILSPVQANEKDDARGLVTLAAKENFDISLNYELKARGAKWLNELPNYKGMCTKCKTVKSQTDRTPDVFLSSKAARCDW